MLRSSLMRGTAVLGLILSARLLFGWGVEGHRLVVRIASGMLKPDARIEIGRTLRAGESLAELGSWADDIKTSRRDTDPWHYVDIPIGSAGFDWKRDCPRQNCVVAKLLEFQKEWRDPTLDSSRRREALLFLIHFAGDIHQPLHCVDNHDKGGNDVAVAFRGKRTNLHALWDFGMLDHMAPEEELSSAIRARITPENVAKWSKGTVEDWANESFRLAQSAAYASLPPVSAGSPVPVEASYQLAAEPIIREQLAKAAVRLAAILNEGAR